MKAEKINELIDWAKEIDIKRVDVYDYKDMSEELLDDYLEFDGMCNDEWEEIICTTYKNIEWKEWYSCVVNRCCRQSFNTPEELAHYIWELYDRAIEILSD